MDPDRWLDALPLAAMACDASGAVRTANARARELFAADTTGALLAELFPEEPGVRELLSRGANDLRLTGRRLNGVPFSAEVDAAAAHDGGVLLLLREVCGAALIAQAGGHLDQAFDRAPVGMALFTTDGEYLQVNRALCELLRRGPAELLGRRDQEFTHPDDRQSDIDAAWRILRGELDVWTTEKRFVDPAGDEVWVIANLVFIRDADGHPLCWFGQFQDISARKRDESHLRHLADHDELTGIANRRRLLGQLAEAISHARRAGDRGALLVLDLDGFKELNDARGHAAGDAALVTVARALAERLRSTDLLARLGGDEFAVLLPGSGPENAAMVAVALLQVVEHASDGALSASCGVACFDHGRHLAPGDLLAQADTAMYAAKAAGRGTARIAA